MTDKPQLNLPQPFYINGRLVFDYGEILLATVNQGFKICIPAAVNVPPRSFFKQEPNKLYCSGENLPSPDESTGLFKLAPVPPTKAMIVAGQEAMDECVVESFSSDDEGNRHDYTEIASDAPFRVYMAMMAATESDEK